MELLVRRGTDLPKSALVRSTSLHLRTFILARPSFASLRSPLVVRQFRSFVLNIATTPIYSTNSLLSSFTIILVSISSPHLTRDSAIPRPLLYYQHCKYANGLFSWTDIYQYTPVLASFRCTTYLFYIQHVVRLLSHSFDSRLFTFSPGLKTSSSDSDSDSSSNTRTEPVSAFDSHSTIASTMCYTILFPYYITLILYPLYRCMFTLHILSY